MKVLLAAGAKRELKSRDDYTELETAAMLPCLQVSPRTALS